MVHIEDISRAFIAAIEAPRETVHTQVFNVGITTENYLVREVADIIAKTYPRVDPCGSAKGRDPMRGATASTAPRFPAKLPRFRPQWTIHRGILELHQRFSEVGLTVEDFEGPNTSASPT